MTFSIERARWCADAEIDLRQAARGAMPAIKADVTQGIAVLWRVTGDSDGWLVTRQEAGELVLVAGAGRNARPVLEWVRDRATEEGLTIRTHITRPGLMRIYQRLGFNERERVFEYGRP